MSKPISLAEFVAKIDKELTELGLSLTRTPDTLNWRYLVDNSKEIVLSVRFWAEVNNRPVYRVSVFGQDENGEDEEYWYDHDELSQALITLLKVIAGNK